MKKTFYYALMSAIALTSAVGFTACSSDDGAVAENVNPTYDGNSVRTDFAFNITKASQGTRMSDANVQETGSFTFRGISYMYLFPFKEVPAANKTTNSSTADPYSGIANNNFSLGELTSSEITNSNSKKIYSMTLPVGTNNFLFYGKATREATATNFQVGRLSSSFYDAEGNLQSGVNTLSNTDHINFNLVTINSDLGSDATNLAAYLTAIAQTTNWAGTVDIVRDHTGDNPGAYSSLADLYAKFTKNTTDRCGSAEALKRTLADLYKGAAAINGQSSVAAVKTIAQAICTNIENGTANLSMQVTKTNADDPETWNFAFRGAGLSDLAFPSGTLKLPMGAAHLYFEGGTFSYIKPNAPSNVSSDGVNLADICYPSELVYFDNSPLRATNSYKKEGDFASSTSAWDVQYQSPASGEDWAGTEVLPTTRAVAMTNNVNYGVALLESTVKLDKANLKDNMAAIVNGASDQTNISGTGMKVTGLLIGGQPASVGWNMIPGSSEGFAKVIYDKDVYFGDALATGTPANKNYTVVLDNFKTGAAQNAVNFALEIQNGTQDFYGAQGMIPAGSTFYLVGQLAVGNGTGRVRAKVKNSNNEDIWRTASTYRITEELTDRVFIQDYKTVANITISEDALQKAYSSIPDLRSTELLFGLSVDLKWEQGLTFNVEL